MPTLRAEAGDITTYAVDAIVNAANEALALGGGVCGAIHRAAGPKLAAACARIGHCPTGEARLPPGFELPARFVVHTVGPVWSGGDRGEDEMLARCYRAILEIAVREGFHTLAIPAISTGIYGFPAVRAAGIAVKTLREAGKDADMNVVLVAFEDSSLTPLRTALASSF